MRKLIRATLGIALLAPISLAVSTPLAHADAADDMTAPIYQVLNPSTGVSLVTAWTDEVSEAKKTYGYTTDLGKPFKASLEAKSGLSAVHRLWNSKTIDFTAAIAGSQTFKNAIAAGYVDEGVDFYASASAITGRTEPVYSYQKSGKHRLATSAVGSSLTGWTREGVAFHVPLTTFGPQADGYSQANRDRHPQADRDRHPEADGRGHSQADRDADPYPRSEPHQV